MNKSQNLQPLLREEVNEMSDKEQLMMLVDKYTDLQRIKSAVDPAKEVEYQIATTKAKLEVYGMVTENLDIK